MTSTFMLAATFPLEYGGWAAYMETCPWLLSYLLGYNQALQIDDEMVEIKEWSACEDAFWPYFARINLWLELNLLLATFEGVLVSIAHIVTM